MGVNPVVAALTGEYLPASITIRAHQNFGRPELHDMTLEDIQQHLVAGVLAQKDKFDESRSQVQTFIDRVAESVLLMLLRERQALKRGGGVPALPLEATTASEQITADGFAAMKRSLLIDAVAALPPELANVAQLLSRLGSESAVAREMGCSRRAVAERIAELRYHFERHGLGGD